MRYNSLKCVIIFVFRKQVLCHYFNELSFFVVYKGFFQTQTMSLGVYATDKDFSSDYRIINHELLERISLTIQRALPILRAIKLRHFMKN